MEAITFRPARRDDLVHIVKLLADDALGSTREQRTEPLPRAYFDAFDAIESDPNNTLIVAEMDGRMVGVLQLTFIPNLTYQGGRRAQIEGLRVAAEARRRGVGRALLEHAIERARDAGCRLVQLTTDKRRPETLRFYERIGFQATHEGMKLWLPED